MTVAGAFTVAGREGEGVAVTSGHLLQDLVGPLVPGQCERTTVSGGSVQATSYQPVYYYQKGVVIFNNGKECGRWIYVGERYFFSPNFSPLN